jgi:clan AA aspartic protease
MGITRITAKVGRGKKAIDVDFMVDSGATYSLLPKNVWEKLKLPPLSEMKFTLADGTVIKRKISEVWFQYLGIGRTSPVILGESKDDALLGAVTLESMGLMLNPFSRELIPMKMMLA